MRIALYQPDIPQNTGTILRLCACLASKRTSSGRLAFRPPTALFGAPGWTLS
jgi:tRNA(Leu) C34 or U34 (ribose-2'-O)-methylase TrmL